MQKKGLLRMCSFHRKTYMLFEVTRRKLCVSEHITLFFLTVFYMNDFLGRLERIRKDVFAELIDWSIGVADLVESFP